MKFVFAIVPLLLINQALAMDAKVIMDVEFQGTCVTSNSSDCANLGISHQTIAYTAKDIDKPLSPSSGKAYYSYAGFTFDLEISLTFLGTSNGTLTCNQGQYNVFASMTANQGAGELDGVNTGVSACMIGNANIDTFYIQRGADNSKISARWQVWNISVTPL